MVILCRDIHNVLQMNDFQNEITAVRERINQLLKDKGITQNAVAAGDAPAQKRINSQLSHGAALSVDTLLRVLAACPDISADWLLRGSGEKNRKTESAFLSESFVKEMLEEKDNQIKALLDLLKQSR